MPATVVEFIGLPGAGKSALAHAAGRVLRDRGVTVHEPTYVLAHRDGELTRRVVKTWQACMASLRGPSESYRWLRTFAGTRQARRGDLIKVTLNWLHITTLVKRAERSSGVVLLDQGMLQALWSVEYDAGASLLDRADLPQRLAACLPKQAVVIVIDASLDTVIRRLAGRPGATSRVEQRSEFDLERRLVRAREVLANVEALATTISAHRGLTLLRSANDDDGDLAVKAEQLADRIAVVLRDAPWDREGNATPQQQVP